MSKNITIQEGGTAKSMTVNKLKTTLVAGGTCLWVPEDEVSLGTKHITENGTYIASDDSKYGYSQVTVNVPGGAGSATSSGTPTTSGGSTPGGIGSSVVGTDPADGNEYGVGVDENGNLVTTKIPSSIAVGKVPDKSSYSDGETIDYSGIIVTLKGGDGEPFANSDYPNGRIPFSELVFPVETIDATGITVDEYSDGAGVNAILITYSPHTQINQQGNEYTVYADITHAIGYKNDPTSIYHQEHVYLYGGTSKGEARILVTKYNNEVYVKRISGNNNLYNVAFYFADSGKIDNFGNAAFTTSENWSTGTWESYSQYVPESTANPINAGEMVPVNATLSLPVKWTSPYDGRVFETTFDVAIVASQESNNGGSSSGDGGGGGHSF